MYATLEIPVVKNHVLYTSIDIELSDNKGTAGSLLGESIEFKGLSNVFSFFIEDGTGLISAHESFATKVSHTKIWEMIEGYCIENWAEVLENNYEGIKS
jgi:hypothetical protein